MGIDMVKELALRKAITILTTGKRNKAPLTAEAVIEVAKKFEAYVLVEEEYGKSE